MGNAAKWESLISTGAGNIEVDGKVYHLKVLSIGGCPKSHFSSDNCFPLYGQRTEMRHIIMHNEEVALSPSWSIHCGVGTQNYTFIWSMAGENQVFMIWTL